MKKIHEISDNQIVRRIRDGKKEQYRIIVERYEGKLTRYVFTIIHDSDITADVVQNTFIKAYVNLNMFDQKRKFSTWIYRIAHNEAINALKKESKNIHPDDEQWFDRLPSSAAPIAKTVDQALLQTAMSGLIDGLPLKYKDPLVLYYFEGQSYRQISGVLRLPVATIGTRINRAKNLLKQGLKEKGIDYDW